MTQDSTTHLVWIKTRLSETDHAHLKKLADRDQRSIAAFVRKLLLDYLNAHP